MSPTDGSPRAALLVAALALLVSLALQCAPASGRDRSTIPASSDLHGSRAADSADGPGPHQPLESPSADGGAAATAGTAAVHEPATPSNPFAPTFEQEMRCRRQHCYPTAARHCFDTCYKYNHPRDPATHTRCNDSCRSSWDVDACEQACAQDRRAYVPEPASTDSACRAALRSCRAGCGPERPNGCELRCLQSLATCAE